MSCCAFFASVPTWLHHEPFWHHIPDMKIPCATQSSRFAQQLHIQDYIAAGLTYKQHLSNSFVPLSLIHVPCSDFPIIQTYRYSYHASPVPRNTLTMAFLCEPHEGGGAGALNLEYVNSNAVHVNWASINPTVCLDLFWVLTLPKCMVNCLEGAVAERALLSWNKAHVKKAVS